MTYQELKLKCLERFFSRTNDKQREAIFKIDGAVLIIAGAGSGKTTVLCNRITNMLLFGDAYNCAYEPPMTKDDLAFLGEYADGRLDTADFDVIKRLSDLIGYNRVAPYNILAVTFTNKAAGELKERLGKYSASAGEVWASTFHSCCVKILRRGIDLLGYGNNFTIYDSDDSQKIIKLCLKDLGHSDNKTITTKSILSQISRAKDMLIPPSEFSTDYNGKKDFLLSIVQQVYLKYQEHLSKANALDFDDIIVKTVELFEKNPEVLKHWQKKFRYIMVDEYQDTNIAQYRLISLLAKGGGNLCVVGDEDQSIYRFRGATIENILSYEKEFKASVIKLEQNYRSTETILNAANAVIKNNTERKDKTLWSDLGEGEKIDIRVFSTEQEETIFIANTVLDHVGAGGKFIDNAILYRTNAQSRNVELAFSRMSIPYKIIGGTRFFERKEIKDILAYMSVLENPNDRIRISRIINMPKRNIGDATQNEIYRVADETGLNTLEVLLRAEEIPSLAKKAKHLLALGNIFTELGANIHGTGVERNILNLVDDIIELTGYKQMLKSEGDDGEMRLENIRELKSSIINFCDENPDAGLSEYLEQVSLISDMDSYETGDDKVTLMTMHSAKGLEFENVFITGAEENIFPSFRSMTDATELEEERRLAYVAITRAKKRLYVLTAKERLLYGSTQRNRLSRFIKEIPEDLVVITDNTASKSKPSDFKKAAKPLGYLQSQTSANKTIKPAEKSGVTFREGDRVSHKVFGPGTVLDASPMGGDTLLEIAFDRIGTKKIMANFGKVEKI